MDGWRIMKNNRRTAMQNGVLGGVEAMYNNYMPNGYSMMDVSGGYTAAAAHQPAAPYWAQQRPRQLGRG